MWWDPEGPLRIFKELWFDFWTNLENCWFNLGKTSRKPQRFGGTEGPQPRDRLPSPRLHTSSSHGVSLNAASILQACGGATRSVSQYECCGSWIQSRYMWWCLKLNESSSVLFFWKTDSVDVMVFGVSPYRCYGLGGQSMIWFLGVGFDVMMCVVFAFRQYRCCGVWVSPKGCDNKMSAFDQRLPRCLK